MKNIFASTVLFGVLFVACNNSGNNGKAKDTVATASPATASVVANNANTSVKQIIDGYLQMKNALVSDNDKEAAAAGKSMVTAFAAFNKTTLTPDQQKVYTDIEDDAKEHAEHIGKNAGNIKHQREHFEGLSKDIYDLAKALNTGQNLYYDHCPMYNNNKGANWLSETKEIHNPYLGKSMPDCGIVKETLK
jgi:hypothetical protein